MAPKDRTTVTIPAHVLATARAMGSGNVSAYVTHALRTTITLAARGEIETHRRALGRSSTLRLPDYDTPPDPGQSNVPPGSIWRLPPGDDYRNGQAAEHAINDPRVLVIGPTRTQAGGHGQRLSCVPLTHTDELPVTPLTPTLPSDPDTVAAAYDPHSLLAEKILKFAEPDGQATDDDMTAIQQVAELDPTLRHWLAPTTG